VTDDETDYGKDSDDLTWEEGERQCRLNLLTENYVQ
jgi:hypothetical protein